LLQQLGESDSPPEAAAPPGTPGEFDRSIRRLAGLISSFAHNPIHRSNKVFNAKQAAQARSDLSSIIELSKAIEGRAKGYAAQPQQGN
jgi:hypothetical protein